MWPVLVECVVVGQDHTQVFGCVELGRREPLVWPVLVECVVVGQDHTQVFGCVGLG